MRNWRLQNKKMKQREMTTCLSFQVFHFENFEPLCRDKAAPKAARKQVAFCCFIIIIWLLLPLHGNIFLVTTLCHCA